MVIGLLMVKEEGDILARTYLNNVRFVDELYEVDGDLEGRGVDGDRHIILDKAYRDHGHDHWFLLLHADEIWTGLPDLDSDHDGFIFNLPLHVPEREWDYTRHPVDQLTTTLSPGYPEFRMFKGGPQVRYDPGQHFNVQPAGLTNVGWCDKPIHHYPYRSPEQNRLRAAATWDPDNYRGVPDVFAPEDIAALRLNDHYRILERA